MRLRYSAIVAGAMATAAMAQPLHRPDLGAAIAEILDRDPELKEHIVGIEPREIGVASEPLWDRTGVDTDEILAEQAGGPDNNLLVLVGPPDEFAAELRANRPVAELIPNSWAEILTFGEVDIDPRHPAILFIQTLGHDRVVFYRAPRWRQGTTSCFGPVSGVAIYSRSGDSAPVDRAALEREVALSFGPTRGETTCERFEGNRGTGFSRRRYLPDGRPLPGASHWETRRAFIRPLPLAGLLEGD